VVEALGWPPVRTSCSMAKWWFSMSAARATSTRPALACRAAGRCLRLRRPRAGGGRPPRASAPRAEGGPRPDSHRGETVDRAVHFVEGAATAMLVSERNSDLRASWRSTRARRTRVGAPRSGRSSSSADRQLSSASTRMEPGDGAERAGSRGLGLVRHAPRSIRPEPNATPADVEGCTPLLCGRG